MSSTCLTCAGHILTSSNPVATYIVNQEVFAPRKGENMTAICHLCSLWFEMLPPAGCRVTACQEKGVAPAQTQAGIWAGSRRARAAIVLWTPCVTALQGSQGQLTGHTSAGQRGEQNTWNSNRHTLSFFIKKERHSLKRDGAFENYWQHNHQAIRQHKRRIDRMMSRSQDNESHLAAYSGSFAATPHEMQTFLPGTC